MLDKIFSEIEFFFTDFLGGLKDIVTGEVDIWDVADTYLFLFRNYITTSVTEFFSSSRESFIQSGQKIFNSFDVDDSFSFFSSNFIFWIIGFFVGAFILKFVIQAIVDFISRIIDIT
ncbi:MAG: hypothetical protein K6G33_00065 [Ruminococcus sp.]|uniref:hypothetical protein n=1 Tax=Ruminococcus sp. TaxID=41978 RepID=UPI0025FE2F56|nr:hypothetical protein [Ruminococcus sp.]MCR5599126.1 hypothetical protein [Ruminococcus sp.]